MSQSHGQRNKTTIAPAYKTMLLYGGKLHPGIYHAENLARAMRHLYDDENCVVVRVCARRGRIASGADITAIIAYRGNRAGWRWLYTMARRLSLSMPGRWERDAQQATIVAPGVLDELIQMLNSPDPDVRHDAAEALGRLNDPRAVPALRQMLEHETDTHVRLAAGRALGCIGDPRTVPALLRELDSPDVAVRAGAGYALRLIGDPCAVPGLCRALLNPDPYTRQIVADTLGHIGDGRAVPALVQALTSTPTRTEPAAELLGSEHDARWAAARALVALRNQCAIPLLRQALDHEPAPTGDTQLAIVYVLWRLEWEIRMAGSAHGLPPEQHT